MSSLVSYPFLQPVFWSYRLKDLDSEIHKDLIIKQVLNYGTADAVSWLTATYTPADIKQAIGKSVVGEWSKKSLALWSCVYNTMPRETRFNSYVAS